MTRKRKALVAASQSLQLPDFEDDNTWHAVETAYGKQISSEARIKIGVATNNYIATACIEQNAASIGDVSAAMAKIKKGAQDLSGLVAYPKSLGPYDGGAYARHLISNHIRHPSFYRWRRRPRAGERMPKDPLTFIESILTAVVAACDRGEAELQDNDHSIREGDGWKLWIRQLTAIAESCGMPTGVRKDFVIFDRVSPFGNLVKALQEWLPKELRRHDHSSNSLAKAIGQARSKSAPN